MYFIVRYNATYILKQLWARILKIIFGTVYFAACLLCLLISGKGKCWLGCAKKAMHCKVLPLSQNFNTMISSGCHWDILWARSTIEPNLDSLINGQSALCSNKSWYNNSFWLKIGFEKKHFGALSGHLGKLIFISSDFYWKFQPEGEILSKKFAKRAHIRIFLAFRICINF